MATSPTPASSYTLHVDMLKERLLTTELLIEDIDRIPSVDLVDTKSEMKDAIAEGGPDQSLHEESLRITRAQQLENYELREAVYRRLGSVRPKGAPERDEVADEPSGS